jgi:hypothetical protein
VLNILGSVDAHRLFAALRRGFGGVGHGVEYVALLVDWNSLLLIELMRNGRSGMTRAE